MSYQIPPIGLDGFVLLRRMEKCSNQYTVSNCSTKLLSNIRVFPLFLNISWNVSVDARVEEC
jgi:hypothetical protein